METNNKIGAIKRAIEYYIHPDNNRSSFYVSYGNWYCGVTNDEAIRKAQHKYEKKVSALHFRAWHCETKLNSLKIEAFFHDKGMRENPNRRVE